MALVAAQLQVNIGGNSTGAEAAMARVGSQVEESTGRFGALKNAIGFAFGQAIFQVATMAITGIITQVKSLVSDTQDLQSAMTQTATVLASTGDASGMTAQQIRAMAVALSQVTPFSDLAIQSSENMLLTFTTIGRETFPAATQAILDTSQAMKEDLKSATVQIGKALDDPIKGVTALTRIGVTFTAQQKEQIKAMQQSGDMAGAQAIVLKELEREFGGSAKAAGTTFAGSLAILNNQFTLMKERIGTAVLPEVAKLFSAIGPLVGVLANGMPSALAKTGDFLGAVGRAATPFIAIFAQQGRNELTVLGNVFTGVLVPALQLVAEIISQDLGPAALALGNWFEQNIMPIFVAVSEQIKSTMIPAFQNIQHIFEQNQPAIKQLGQELSGLLPVVKFLAVVIGGVLLVAIKIIALNFQAMAQGIVILINIFNAIADVVGHVVSWFQHLGSNSKQSVSDMVTTIVTFITRLPQEIPFLIGEMIGLAIKAVIFLETEAPKRIAAMIGQVLGNIGQFRDNLPRLIMVLAIDAVQWFEHLRTQAVQKIVQLAVGIEAELQKLPGQLVTLAQQFMQGLVNGIVAGQKWVIDAIQNLAGNMLDGIRHGLGIHSPSAAMHDVGAQTVRGFINGLLSQSPAQVFAQHIKALTQPVQAGALSLGTGGMGALGSAALATLPMPLATQAALVTMQSTAVQQQQGAGQPIIITLDGRRVGTGLMPHITSAIKQATGVKVQVR